MSSFSKHRKDVNLLAPRKGKKGLRDSQMGGLSAAVSHFTVHDDPALICMPTGSGKTAVLMTLCYLLSAKKVLIITPSQLVRYQIARDFEKLGTLRYLGVLADSVPAPRVAEVKNKVTSIEAWKKLLDENDVLVATPNSISPALKDVEPAPSGAFDVVLVDEAHHSRAKTWATLLANFPKAKQVLFTATPFRNDGREIRARFLYNYPLSKAVKDKTFGQIRYVPIDADSEEEADRAIAQKVEEVFQQDLAAGLDHRVIVRTSRKDKAEALKRIYQKHAPSLKLQVVSSDKSMATIEKAIADLEAGTLHGIICVDMLGEGFDLPNLKIAGLHAPHKSLAITLQFIGRFARTSLKKKDQKIGEAKFVAALNDMKVEAAKLFEEDADWIDIIQNLSEKRIGLELSTQEFFEPFRTITEFADADGRHYLTKGSFRPFCHVKVYKLADPNGFQLDATVETPKHEVIYHEVADTHQTAILAWATRKKPKWLKDDILSNVSHELAIIHYHPESRLMFVCSSDRKNEFYAHVVDRFIKGPSHEQPICVLRRTMANWKDERFSSVGMRSRRYRKGTESYRIMAGSNAHLAVHDSDGDNYIGGHSMGQGQDEKNKQVLLGLSSTSKLWTISYVPIPKLVEWCDNLAVKIADDALDTAPMPLAMFDYGKQIRTLPAETVFVAEWADDAFKNGRRVKIVDAAGDGEVVPLQDVDILVDPARSTSQHIIFTVAFGAVKVDYQLSVDPHPLFERLPGQVANVFVCSGHEEDGDFCLYLNGRSPTFFFEDMSSLAKDVYVARKAPVNPFDENRLDRVDWPASNVDIEQEVVTTRPGHVSIHGHLEATLPGKFDVLIYDQGAGEVADFIGLKRGPDPEIVLYHCKGTKPRKDGKPAKPGNRVEDLYEVCMQAVRSTRWADKRRLIENLQGTTRTGRRFITGTPADAQAILDSIGGRDLAMEVIIVQPGLKSVPNLNVKMGQLLGAVDEHLHVHTGSRLTVMCS